LEWSIRRLVARLNPRFFKGDLCAQFASQLLGP
jgi:hypothetical protein